MSDNRFDLKAREWDKKRSRRELAAAVSAAIGKLPLDRVARAMDFGCGTGLVSLPLAAQIGSIVALDSSAGMIEVLRGKLEENGIDNIEPCCADLLTTDIPGDFDLILTSMTLHHIEAIEPIIEKFYQILASGGRIAVADLDAEDGSFHSSGSGERHHGFGRTEFTKILDQAGFTEISFQTVHTISKTMDDGSSREFTIFLATAKRP